MSETNKPITTNKEDLEKLNSLLLIELIRAICIIHATGESHAITILDILESRISELEEQLKTANAHIAMLTKENEHLKKRVKDLTLPASRHMIDSGEL